MCNTPIQADGPGGGNSYENYHTDVVTTVCYLAGLSDEKLSLEHFAKDKVEELKNNEKATIIRYLCDIRCLILRNYA